MSNLFSPVTVEQQEIVAGGFSRRPNITHKNQFIGKVVFNDSSRNNGVAIGQNKGNVIIHNNYYFYNINIPIYF
ncbi:hypothetical protein [Anabaena sp. UHCC 0204]|uniref:hypothetical protein n=1 Tax=Anabaena sp. UHCC 0204 TaxID=2590009 RepID=UPI0014487BE7|nr:hypothetical protein [Anabaena sp. UHCC 0204]MTJ08465.1 hypothetical protein [Anabaena sp. UHCC 0204]